MAALWSETDDLVVYDGVHDDDLDADEWRARPSAAAHAFALGIALAAGIAVGFAIAKLATAIAGGM